MRDELFYPPLKVGCRLSHPTRHHIIHRQPGAGLFHDVIDHFPLPERMKKRISAPTSMQEHPQSDVKPPFSSSINIRITRARSALRSASLPPHIRHIHVIDVGRKIVHPAGDINKLPVIRLSHIFSMDRWNITEMRLHIPDGLAMRVMTSCRTPCWRVLGPKLMIRSPCSVVPISSNMNRGIRLSITVLSY